MDIAFVSALAALGGSIIGGLTSGMTAWVSQRDQVKAGQLAHDKSRREDLYKDFIVTASKMFTDALMNKDPKVEDFVALRTMVTRMQIVSSMQIIACAEKAMNLLADSYAAPSKTPHELREFMKTSALNPLKAFSEAARHELRAST